MAAGTTGRQAALLVVLLAVGAVQLIPWNAYPQHLDEYLHWGFAQEAQRQQSVSFGDPFSGEGTAHFTLESHLHERGFHALLAVFQSATGIDWLILFQFGPALIAMLLAAAAFLLMEPAGAGVEAALWIAAIPTTLRFLGPSYLVPIGLGLALLLVALWLLTQHARAGGLAAAAIFSAALWPIHALAGATLLALAAIQILFLLTRSGWKALLIAAAVALPFALSQSLAARAFATDAISSGITLTPSLEEIRLLGAIPFLLAGVGAASLAIAGGRAMALGVTLWIGLAVAATPLLLRTLGGYDTFALYDRSIIFLFVFCALLAGAGVAALRRAILGALTRLAKRPLPTAVIVSLGLLLLVPQGALVASAHAAASETPTYEALDDTLYHSLLAARERLPPSYERGVVDGISSMPFTILTGRPTLAAHYPWSEPDPALRAFFDRGANDTYLLVETRTSIVVTRQIVTNPDLEPIAPYVYVLRSDYVERMRANE